MFNVYLQSNSARSTKCGTKYCRYQKFAVILQSISETELREESKINKIKEKRFYLRDYELSSYRVIEDL